MLKPSDVFSLGFNERPPNLWHKILPELKTIPEHMSAPSKIWEYHSDRVRISRMN